MKEMLGTRQTVHVPDAAEMFSAGMHYLAGNEYAYLCFRYSGYDDGPTLFNMALCCYCISWYDESYRLLCDAEKRLPPCQDTRLGDLPGKFADWQQRHSTPFSPIPKGAPNNLVTLQVLRLKAEAANKLNYHAEVRDIASRLGNRYSSINEPTKQ